jgi:Flp pilus assembly protein TadD
MRMKKPDSQPQKLVESKLVPTTTATLFKEGCDAKKSGELKKAESCFEQVLMMDSQHTPSLIRLGLVQKEIGEESKAISHFVIASGHSTQKWKINGQDAVLFGFLQAANLYVDKCAYSDAIDILETGLEIFPSDNNLLNAIAWAYFYKGDYLNAVSFFDKILQSSMIDSGFFMTIKSAKALALLLADNLAEAKEIYDQWQKDFDSLGLTPNTKNQEAFIYARLGAGLYFFQSKQTKWAEKYFKEALTAANEKLKQDLLLLQGIGLGALGHHQLALKCFQEILDKDKRFLPALFHSGIAYTKLDERLKAKENFEIALGLWPDNRDIVQALQSLPDFLPDKELKYSCSVGCMSSDTYLKLMKTVVDKLKPQFQPLLDKAGNKSQRLILQEDCMTAAEREFNKALINELASNYSVLERWFDRFVYMSTITQSPLPSTVFFLKEENALLFTLNRQLQRKLKLLKYHQTQINHDRVKQMQEIYSKELKPLQESLTQFRADISKAYYEPPDKYFSRINKEQTDQYEILKTVVLKLQADSDIRTLLGFNDDQKQEVDEKSKLKNGVHLLSNLKPALMAKQEKYNFIQREIQDLHVENLRYKMNDQEQQIQYRKYTRKLTANLSDLLTKCNRNNEKKKEAPKTEDPIIKDLSLSLSMVEQLKSVIESQKEKIDQLQKIVQRRTSTQKINSNAYSIYGGKFPTHQRETSDPIAIELSRKSSSTDLSSKSCPKQFTLTM